MAKASMKAREERRRRTGPKICCEKSRIKGNYS